MSPCERRVRPGAAHDAMRAACRSPCSKSPRPNKGGGLRGASVLLCPPAGIVFAPSPFTPPLGASTVQRRALSTEAPPEDSRLGGGEVCGCACPKMHGARKRLSDLVLICQFVKLCANQFNIRHAFYVMSQMHSAWYRSMSSMTILLVT